MSANTGDAHSRAGDGSHLFPQENDYHALFEDAITEDKERLLATLNQEVDINAKQPPYGETVLHLAARKAYESIMKVLLSRGADLEILDDDGWTPLISACRGGSQEVVELLLERIEILAKATRYPSQDTASQNDSNTGVPAAASITMPAKSYINISGIDGSTALTMACWMSTAEVVDSLLDKGANVDAQDDDGDIPLILAARHGNTRMVENVLNYKPDIRKFRNDGRSALHQAIQNDNNEDRESIMDQLLGAGLSSSHKDNEGSTPLHMASDCGYSSIVDKLLTQDELNVNAQNNDKETPLHLACRKGHLEVVRRLTNCHRIELNLRSASSATPLFLAVENDHLEVVTKLLDQTGIDANNSDYLESTPLHVACRQGYLKIVKKLINVKEIELNAKDLYTRTPIFWAIIGRHSEVVQTLLNQTGLDLGATDYANRTPLHEASEIGSLEIVKMITNKTREHINAQDDLGLTALHLACKKGHVSVAEHLFSEGAKSRVSRDSTQSAWFFFVQYLFEFYEDSDSREGSVSKSKSSMPDPGEFEFILAHADKEERASATIWADNSDKRTQLAHAMGIDVSKLVDYELVRSAKSLDSSDTAKIVKVLQRVVITFDPQPASALQWAAYHGRHDVVWWLLKNSTPGRIATQPKDDREVARKIAITRRDQLTQPKEDREVKMGPMRAKEGDTEGTKEKKKGFKLTVDMLTDPPVVEDTPFDSWVDYDISQEEILGKHWATIVDFYQRDEKVELLRRSESVFNVIYANARPNDEDKGPEGIMNKARTDLKKISKEAAKLKEYEKKDLLMRWVHLPANIMKWMEDLTKRISNDKKISDEQRLSLNDLTQRSWQELPTNTAPAKFMKPVCLKASSESLQLNAGKKKLDLVKRQPNEDHDQIASPPARSRDPEGSQPALSQEKPKHSRAEDYSTEISGSPDPLFGGSAVQKTEEYERVALYMPYITFGLCHRKEPSTPKKKVVGAEAAGKGVAPRKKEALKKELDALKRYDDLIESCKNQTIHGSRSLDQFFYNSLPDDEMVDRDQNQVFTRSFFRTPNGNGVPKEHQTWPYLAVDQLWLWVIDEGTIITSSTHRKDNLNDPVSERLFDQLRQANMNKNEQPLPSSVQDMTRFIVTSCVNFMQSLKWEHFSPMRQPGPDDDTVSSMPVQSLYEERINQAAIKEKELFHKFKMKMSETKNKIQRFRSKKQSHHETATRDANHRSEAGIADGGEVSKGNRYQDRDWESISGAADLLDEVKDVLDELSILKTLVTRQLDVWQELVGDDTGSKNARDPTYTLRSVQEMIEMADRVQQSVNGILSLEQNGISIDQAQESARQGTILMAFTIVTVIFTPLSFLTSLFALNITVFQHNSSGDIEYEPGWIFPILFCCSTAIIGLLMIYAFREKYLYRGMHILREIWRQRIVEKRRTSQEHRAWRKKASSQGEHDV